jgi:hypothetical protein
MIERFLKIGSLALVGVVLVLGTVAAQKTTGGGGTADIPLKAILSEGPIGAYPTAKITNDYPGLWYAHQGTKSGQNQVLISQPGSTGRFLFVIYGTTGRWLNLYLDSILYAPVPIANLPPEYDCLQPYFIYPQILPVIKTTAISISTTLECKYISHTDETGTWAELVPYSKQYLNFAKMSKGQTKYVCGRGNTVQFRTTDDPATANYDESVDSYNLFQEPQYFTVKAGDWDQDGIMDWIITPFVERFKNKEADGTWTDYPYGCVPRRVTSSYFRSCDHGTYFMPFELKIARLK